MRIFPIETSERYPRWNAFQNKEVFASGSDRHF